LKSIDIRSRGLHNTIQTIQNNSRAEMNGVNSARFENDRAFKRARCRLQFIQLDRHILKQMK